MTLTLEKCTLQHIDQLIDVSKETFDDTFRANNTAENMAHYLATAFTMEKMTDELNHPHSQFFFALLDGDIAGYVKVNTEDAQTEQIAKAQLEIERIYIRQNFQKRGIGQLLMNKALHIAQSKGYAGIWLGVWEKNPNAIRFYEKAGFKQAGNHSFYMGDEEQTDYIMVKVLR